MLCTAERLLPIPGKLCIASSVRRMCASVVLICCAGIVPAAEGAGSADPWKELFAVFHTLGESNDGAETDDPWRKLRLVYLPFTEADEKRALSDRVTEKELGEKLAHRLAPYKSFIDECSRTFSVPSEIISAVILVESGGNPNAAARTSSAKGLMQTIKSTFRDARCALAKRGISIDDSPFTPRASIYAGSWYLRHVFDLAQKDNPRHLARSSIEDWCLPAKYYYAGPTDGARREQVIIKYADGKRVVIDKETYCGKVLRYARLLQQRTG